MTHFYPVAGTEPDIHESAFVAATAVIIGRATFGMDASALRRRRPADTPQRSPWARAQICRTTWCPMPTQVIRVPWATASASDTPRSPTVALWRTTASSERR